MMLFGQDVEYYVEWRDKLIVSGLVRHEDGIEPFSVADDELSFFFDQIKIIKLLQSGSVIYIHNFDGYIGRIEGEGPSYENQDVVVDYEATNFVNLQELLITLNNIVVFLPKASGKKRVRLPYEWWQHNN